MNVVIYSVEPFRDTAMSEHAPPSSSSQPIEFQHAEHPEPNVTNGQHLGKPGQPSGASDQNGYEQAEQNVLNGITDKYKYAPQSGSSRSRTVSASSQRSIPTNRQSARLRRSPANDRTLITELTGSDSEDELASSKFSLCSEDTRRNNDTEIIPCNSTSLAGHDEEDDGNLSDETKLEVDIDGLLNPDRVTYDTTGRTEYLRACDRESTTPASVFLRNIQEREFVMRYRGLGPQGAKALSVPLERNTIIERLDLEGNWIEAQGAIHLADMLKENYYISELLLAENMIGDKGVRALCDVLQDNTTVLKLDLSGNVISDEAVPFIHEMLKKNFTLKHLHLSHNEIEDSGARLFKAVLADNESLETLNLSWNRIRTQGTIWLAEGIQENIGLKYFYLSMNGMELGGAQEIGKALKQNRSLVELDISYNRIPLDAAVFVSAGLQVNDTLQTLKIGSNPLGEDGAFTVLNSIDRNDSTALTFLDLTNIVVTGAFEELKVKLEKSKGLRVVHGGMINSRDVLVDMTDAAQMEVDPLEAFKRDPMTKLRQYVQASGLRLVDLFKQLDKDQNLTISRKEFIDGIIKADIGLDVEKIEILLTKIDKDRDGQIDFGELIYSEKEYRRMQRNAQKLHDEMKKAKGTSK